MEDKELEKHELKDVTTSWVSTSRYLFYLSIAATVAFCFAMCVALYMHRYTGNPKVEVPSSSLYHPTYK